MPWTPEDAYRHTRRAATAVTRRQWAHVANKVLKETGDEARAIREANAVLERRVTQRKRKKS
jgi:hypothetical protein